MYAVPAAHSICSVWLFKLLQNQLCEGGGLHAVLHMCPTLTNTVPSQPRLRETLTKCPLQTLHYYNISTHNIGLKQTEINSPTQRLFRGGHGMPRSTGHTWSYPVEKVILPKGMTWSDNANASRQIRTIYYSHYYIRLILSIFYIRAPTFSSHLDESRIKHASSAPPQITSNHRRDTSSTRSSCTTSTAR